MSDQLNSVLPCTEGPDRGVVWDATARSMERPRLPVWNNYLRMAKQPPAGVTSVRQV